MTCLRFRFHPRTLLLSFCLAPFALGQGSSYEFKQQIPQPILEEHTGWVDLYFRAFEIAFSKIKKGTPQNKFVENYMDEAFSDNIFQWDTTFMTLFGRYSNGQLPSIVSLDNFYRAQDANGWIGRELRELDGSSYWPNDGSYKAQCSINPPLFSFAEWKHYEVTGDKSRFLKDIQGKPLLQRLVDYYDWIKTHRRWSNGLYWTTGYANGMDNSPRLKPKDECDHASGSWIDITAQQALNALYIARIAAVTGNTVLQQRFEAEHAHLKKRINRNLWDPKDGFYYDKDANNRWSKVKTPASFWPILAEVADPAKLQRLIHEHLLNPNEFWTLHHLPSLAANDPGFIANGGYWNGAVWAPTSYQTLLGLAHAGEHQLAQRIANNHLEHLYWVYRSSHTLYENYQPEAVAKGPLARPDFVGWTGVIPISGLIENILGIRVNAPEDTLTWHLQLSERHGIRQLVFGDNRVDLIAEDRLTPESGTQLHITSNSPFQLDVVLGKDRHPYAIGVGTTHITLGTPIPQLQAEGFVHNALQEQVFGSLETPEVLQVFYPSQSGQLKGLDIKIRPLLPPQQLPSLTARLYALDTPEKGLHLNPVPLAQQQISGANLERFYSVLHLPFNGILLQTGTAYALTLSADTPQKKPVFSWLTGAEVSPQGYFARRNERLWLADYTTGDAWLKWYWTPIKATP